MTAQARRPVDFLLDVPSRGPTIALLCCGGYSMIDQLYSMAARCSRCDHRAILSSAAADVLVSASGRRLASFRCPDERGWHVRYPGIEGGGKTHRRGWR